MWDLFKFDYWKSYFSSPQLKLDFQNSVISLLQTLSSNFWKKKLLLWLGVLNTILLFYSLFCFATYSNGLIASFNIFIQFLMYASNNLIMDFGMQIQICSFKIIFKIYFLIFKIFQKCWFFLLFSILFKNEGRLYLVSDHVICDHRKFRFFNSNHTKRGNCLTFCKKRTTTNNSF